MYLSVLYLHMQPDIRAFLYVTTLILTLLASTGTDFSDGTEVDVHATSYSASSAGKKLKDMHNDSISTDKSVNTSVNDILKGSMTNLSEVRSMCPGAVEFYMNQTDPTVYPVKMSDCKQLPNVDDIKFKHRWLYGQCDDSLSFCHVLIQVPDNMTVRARIEFLTLRPRFGNVYWGGWRLLHFEKKYNKCLECADRNLIGMMPIDKPFIFLSTTNQLYMHYDNSPGLRIRFEALRQRLDIRYKSDHSGFVTILHPEGRGTVCDWLIAPEGNVIMINFERILLSRCGFQVTVHCKELGSARQTEDMFSTDPDRVIKLYNTSRLEVCAYVDTYSRLPKPCFKLLFSFHSDNEIPQRLSSGMYNCSVDYYWRFAQHMDCNLKVECEDGRDEAGHCPYSSPACDGWVAAQYKCYRRFSAKFGIAIYRAPDRCRALGFELATVKTQQELDYFTKIGMGRTDHGTFFGLRYGSASMPSMYRHFLSWSDKTAIYNVEHISFDSIDNPIRPWYYLYSIHKHTLNVEAIQPYEQNIYFICERPAQFRGIFSAHTVADFFSHQQLKQTFQQPNHPMVVCPRGHVAHAFLSCDIKSHCGQSTCFFTKDTRTWNVTEIKFTDWRSIEVVAMYSCSNSERQVSYSLLCDFRQDCDDNSDENFCHHPVCKEFSCQNGQCLSMTKHCNKYIDCLNGIDEKNCQRGKQVFYMGKKYENKNHSFLINLDGMGYFTQQVMNVTDSCPSTHYRCTKEWFYCLPVYTRCNGVFDCIFQEDERDCEGWTCPGLYRCRDSTVCAHADHMCDGWPQCPQRDDEWLCDMTCPAQCLCQGHAFLCPQPFTAQTFNELRYLDASGSGMTLFDLVNNT